MPAYSSSSPALQAAVEPPGDAESGLFARLRQEPAALPEIFAALYRQYLAPVYRYLFARTGAAAEAEDLTSQVFLAALEGLPNYQHRGQFAAWLFAIARRKAADFHRARYAHPHLELAPAEPAPAPDPLAQVIHSEELQRLTGLVGSLDEDERELLRLRFAAGLSFVEIAALLQRSPSATKMALYRLLARLESRLEVNDD
jgi:RNA polymerase sigma-70 factor, ECF subfamily